jgi:hypothetical protein
MTARACVLALFVAGCSPPAPPALAAEIQCAPETHVLRQLCTVTLTDRRTGARVDGAAITLSADMPSMPLAHSVRPVTAQPAGPGIYRGILELEMTGRWVVAVRVTGPVHDQFTHMLDVQ